MTDVKKVAAKGEFSLILKEDNTLWAAGDNGQGQFGNGSVESSSIPVMVRQR